MSKETKWHHNIWLVLFLLFFVLGPLGLPLVWKNPRFSQTAKIVLTVLMAGYTLLLVWMIAGMLQAVQASLEAVKASLSF